MREINYQFPHVRYDEHVKDWDRAQNNSERARFLQLRYERSRVIHRERHPLVTTDELQRLELQHGKKD